MGWSSEGYSYTKEQIDRTAFAAGCGKGWYWIHKRPNMFIKGTIDDDGKYNLTFYKAITSQFNYFLRIKINGKLIFNFGSNDLNWKKVQKSVSGDLGPVPKATLEMFCGDRNCDVDAGKPQGKVILDVDLYPYIGIYHNNQWHRGMIYIFTKGEWKLYKAYIRGKDEWRRTITIKT